MQNKIIVLISFIFLMGTLPVAQAGASRITVNDTQNQAAALDDEALASYITGRLKLALKNDTATVEQYCDQSGCAIVVQ